MKPLRAVPGFPATVYVMVPLLIPVAALVMVIQVSLGRADHGQLVAATLNDPFAAEGPNVAAVGNSVMSQAAIFETNASCTPVYAFVLPARGYAPAARHGTLRLSSPTPSGCRTTILRSA